MFFCLPKGDPLWTATRLHNMIHSIPMIHAHPLVSLAPVYPQTMEFQPSTATTLESALIHGFACSFMFPFHLGQSHFDTVIAVLPATQLLDFDLFAVSLATQHRCQRLNHGN